MKRNLWQIGLAAGLLIFSILFYGLHYAIFHDAHHIFIYLLGDIAFVPVEVLLVTLILHRLLEAREKKSRLNKMNMAIGAFFSEVGNDLLNRLTSMDSSADQLRSFLAITRAWSDKEFAQAAAHAKAYEARISADASHLGELRAFLVEKRTFLLILLENPNLLEHERFTDLLWAVFHLMEELDHRGDLFQLPMTDIEHLSGDILRCYQGLLTEWVSYMRHLKKGYPYLFSLSLRIDPLLGNSDAVVREA